MKRKKLWFIIIAIVLILIVSLKAWNAAFPGTAFDPIAWQDKELVQQGVRLEMADRLVAHLTLHNMTRAEVAKMLGEPRKTDYFRNWDMVYWLGPERSYFSIDSEWLVLRLNKQEIVIDSRIVRD